MVGLPSWARFSVSYQSDDLTYNNDNATGRNISGSKKNTSWGRDTTRGKQIPLPMGVYQWRIDERLGTIIAAENTDTTVHNFQNWKMQDGMKGQYSHTGNTGSARLSRIFIDRREDYNYMFLTPLNFFHEGVSNFLFTNTKSPITNIAYHTCGNKQNGEERVRGNFATNFGKQTGVGFKLDYNYARGYYSSQNLSQFGALLYGYHNGERYVMHTYFNANHMKNAENGGLIEDDYITQPWIYQQKFGSKDIPVNLSSTWNRNDDETFHLTHRYNLGHHREIVLPDSLKPQPPSDKELLLQLTDSVRQILATDSTATTLALDSLRNLWQQKLVKPTEFISVASIIHTVQLRHLDHTFYDQGNNSNYYTHQYWDGNIADRTGIISVRNTVGLSMNEGFRKWVKMGLTFFATHEYRRFNQPNVVAGNYTSITDTENDILVGAELSKVNGRTIHYNANGELCLVGTNVGNFNIEAEGDLNIPLGKKDTASLVVRAKIQNQKPSYLMRNYRNAYIHWDNNHLTYQFSTGLQAELNYSRTNTKLRFGWNNLTNYTYLAMNNVLRKGALEGSTIPSDYTHSIDVRQSNASIEVLTASLSQDFKWKFIGWENEITFQHSTNSEVLPLPMLNIYSNLYLNFRLAKVLRVQIGGDIRYFTAYNAPDYFGAAGMFAVQDTNHKRISIGNYPIVNVYANLHLKQCRLYINAAHVNATAGNMFLVPHMAMNPMNINFGISWNFFN